MVKRRTVSSSWGGGFVAGVGALYAADKLETTAKKKKERNRKKLFSKDVRKYL